LTNTPTPQEVSKRAHLFANNKALGNPHYTADIGVPTTAVFGLMRGSHADRNASLQSIFSDEDHMLWYQRPSKKHIHILISVSSHSLQAHFRAWAHAFVLAQLVTGTPLPTGKSELQILERETGEVAESLKIVNAAFEQGTGIERALVSKGWDVEKSMICPHMEGKVEGKLKQAHLEDLEVLEKRE